MPADPTDLLEKNIPASETRAETITDMCLQATGGKFVLLYSASSMPPSDSYDWIGLYASVDDSDSDYVGGRNWNWATKGTSYTTSTDVVTTGYEARYLIWNGSAYESIKRSGALLPACSD